MTDSIEQASAEMLAPEALSQQQLLTILGSVLDRPVDAADLYLQSSYEESWFLENGIVKSSHFDHDQGFGLRAMSGATVGFAFANDFSAKTLKQAASTVRGIAHGSRSHVVPLSPQHQKKSLYPSHNPLEVVSAFDKVAWMQALDQYIRAQDTRVVDVMIHFGASFDTVMILNSEGKLRADLRPMVSLQITVLIEEKGRRERGFSGAGWRSDYHYFVGQDRSYKVADRALAQAQISLIARPMPAGEMPVVLGPGWPAVLLHEAIGHGLEGDFIRKGSSVYTGKMGQQIASSLCTIVDDGTLSGRRGSLNMDDEGCDTQCTTLIEKGVLKNYMQDSLNARLMGTASTGNGRRESYAQVPLPRMTNTYMLPGEDDPEAIIASVKKGLYAVDFSGGQVDITSGTFVFSTSEAYYIEDGKIQYPVKGATLIGNGLEVLQRIDRVGNDMALDEGTGQCGKAGQTVPVGIGQPTLRVSHMTVGGTQTD